MREEKLIGTHTISSLQELDTLAGELVNQLRSGDVVLLQGDLGAGKTTFTKFLGNAIGVGDEITSPTYTIVAEYPVQNNSEIKKFIHLDLYRSKLDTNYVQEILRTAAEQKAVVVIEWPEMAMELPALSQWMIHISARHNSGQRIVEIEKL